MNIRPFKDNVIVERIKKEEVSSGGIVLPGGDRDEADKAKVIATGPDVPDEISEGTIVLINWQKASRIEGEIYKVAEEDVVGVFEN